MKLLIILLASTVFFVSCGAEEGQTRKETPMNTTGEKSTVSDTDDDNTSTPANAGDYMRTFLDAPVKEVEKYSECSDLKLGQLVRKKGDPETTLKVCTPKLNEEHYDYVFNDGDLGNLEGETAEAVFTGFFTQPSKMSPDDETDKIATSIALVKSQSFIYYSCKSTCTNGASAVGKKEISDLTSEDSNLKICDNSVGASEDRSPIYLDAMSFGTSGAVSSVKITLYIAQTTESLHVTKVD